MVTATEVDTNSLFNKVKNQFLAAIIGIIVLGILGAIGSLVWGEINNIIKERWLKGKKEEE